MEELYALTWIMTFQIMWKNKKDNKFALLLEMSWNSYSGARITVLSGENRLAEFKSQESKKEKKIIGHLPMTIEGVLKS